MNRFSLRMRGADEEPVAYAVRVVVGFELPIHPRSLGILLLVAVLPACGGPIPIPDGLDASDRGFQKGRGWRS